MTRGSQQPNTGGRCPENGNLEVELNASRCHIFASTTCGNSGAEEEEEEEEERLALEYVDWSLVPPSPCFLLKTSRNSVRDKVVLNLVARPFHMIE